MKLKKLILLFITLFPTYSYSYYLGELTTDRYSLMTNKEKMFWVYATADGIIASTVNYNKNLGNIDNGGEFGDCIGNLEINIMIDILDKEIGPKKDVVLPTAFLLFNVLNDKYNHGIR